MTTTTNAAATEQPNTRWPGIKGDGDGMAEPMVPVSEPVTARDRRCSCAHHDDGSVTRFLCPIHADQDPCLTMAMVTGRRRKGSIVRGVCTNCGWTHRATEHPGT